MGQKNWISDRKKCWMLNVYVRISNTFFIYIPQINYSPIQYLFSEANCGSVKTKPKKPVASQWYTFNLSDLRHCLKSERFVCVPKILNVRNLNALKSDLACIQILALSEISTFSFQTFTVSFTIVHWWKKALLADQVDRGGSRERRSRSSTSPAWRCFHNSDRWARLLLIQPLPVHCAWEEKRRPV